MNRQLQYTITEENNNLSIQSFLKIQGFSHPVIVRLKKTENGILLNNNWAHISDRLRTNDILILNIIETDSNEELLRVPLPLDIVYEDEDIIVINKAAGMPVHPSIHNHDNTLANALAYYYKDSKSPFIMRCLNRLDRDTTGLTIIAKNPLSAGILSRNMKMHEVHRTYYAVVVGTPEANGTICAPIARVCDSLITREVNYEMGQNAVTHYRVLTSTPKYSLLEINLETGRTHQIRVHMKHIGHPLPGDFIYYPVFDDIARQALHAGKLEFCHPITREPLTFVAPLPNDMNALLQK